MPQSMAGLQGTGNLGVNMGGMLIDNRYQGNQMQAPGMDYNYQQDLKGGQKV